MATKRKIECEIKRSRLFLKYKVAREQLKNEIRNLRKSQAFSFQEHEIKIQEIRNFQIKLHRLPRNSSSTRRKNRCWATGRSRGFYRDFGLSRHVLREMGFKGLIPGLKKSSW